MLNMYYKTFNLEELKKVKEVVLTVLGGCADIDKNESNVPVVIVDYDNQDELSVNYSSDTLVITVLGGVAEVYQQPEDVQVKIIDYDNIQQHTTLKPAFSFVLNPEHDYAALQALKTYVAQTTNSKLAEKLEEIILEIEERNRESDYFLGT